MAERRPARIVWAPSAERDLGRIYLWLEARGVRGAEAMVRKLLVTVELIGEQPEIGRIAEDIEPVGRFRSHPCAPWRIVYRYDGESVRVVRVWDARRDPTSLHVPDDRDDEP